MGYMDSASSSIFFCHSGLTSQRLTLPEEEAQRRKKQNKESGMTFSGEFIFSFFVLSSLS